LEAAVRETLSSEKLNPRLREKLGVDADLVKSYFHPYVYLDRKAVTGANEG
jgi:hypothetical protein